MKIEVMFFHNYDLLITGGYYTPVIFCKKLHTTNEWKLQIYCRTKGHYTMIKFMHKALPHKDCRKQFHGNK